jgi:adenosine/AMP kinase
MELKSVALNLPEGCNLILGQTHFIKTVEDLHEIMVGTSA